MFFDPGDHEFLTSDLIQKFESLNDFESFGMNIESAEKDALMQNLFDAFMYSCAAFHLPPSENALRRKSR